MVRGSGTEPVRSLCAGPELNRYVPFGTRDFKLRHRARRLNRATKSRAKPRDLRAIPSECYSEHRDLESVVPGTGIEPVRSFRNSGF